MFEGKWLVAVGVAVRTLIEVCGERLTAVALFVVGVETEPMLFEEVDDAFECV